MIRFKPTTLHLDSSTPRNGWLLPQFSTLLNCGLVMGRDVNAARVILLRVWQSLRGGGRQAA